MEDSVLRKTLVEYLNGGDAHVDARKALEGVKSESRNIRPDGLPHSIWELLEHLRIAQEDILRYTLDSSWVSPEFAEGYWPASDSQVTEKTWSDSVTRFFADLDEAATLVRNTGIDLTAKIPHGEGRTYLRQVLLIIDHNAYHLGQIVQVRKALGDWPE
jgi:hypothetical protein